VDKQIVYILNVFLEHNLILLGQRDRGAHVIVVVDHD
jgi:hypothetical protein